MTWRRRVAGFLKRRNRDLGKSGLAQFIPNQFHIVIAVRGSGEKTRRVIGEYRSRRLCHDMSKLVRVDMISDVEKEAATRFEHPARLGVTGDPVREKHDAELTNHGIE